MEDDGNGMGEVQGWIALAAVQGQNPVANPQFVVGETTVLTAKHHGDRPIRFNQPAQGLIGVLQGNRAVIEPAAGGDNPAAISDSGLKGVVLMGRFQHISAMNSHAEGLIPLHITTRSDQAQLINPEIGAEPGNAADVQRTGRFNQDDDDQSVQLMEVTQ